MDDSFRLRVDRAFGSLASSSSSSTTTFSAASTAPSSSLWCLTDDEIERSQWKRVDDDDENDDDPLLELSKKGSFHQNPQFSDRNLLTQIEKDLDDLEDDDDLDDDDDRSHGDSSGVSLKPKPDDYNDEEWEIKNSIGLDSTLDYEEEEDEHDKVAVGKKKTGEGDRLYMRDVAYYGIDVDGFNELPDSFEDVIRDPRANHLAAKLRLKEDDEAAKKMDSLRVSENGCRGNVSEDIGNLKSILKKRDDEGNELESKSQKRVRFDPECKDGESDGVKDVEMEGDSTEEDEAMVYRLPLDYPSGIPDYMRNPSKYTRYTFDSDDVDDQSNRQAYMDFLNMLKKSNNTEPELENGSFNLPTSLTFIPKRKAGDVTMVDSFTESKQNQDDTGKLRRDVPLRIAAGDIQDAEICAMEENEPKMTEAHKGTGSRRPGRHYRMKVANQETDESR